MIQTQPDKIREPVQHLNILLGIEQHTYSTPNHRSIRAVVYLLFLSFVGGLHWGDCYGDSLNGMAFDFLLSIVCSYFFTPDESLLCYTVVLVAFHSGAYSPASILSV